MGRQSFRLRRCGTASWSTANPFICNGGAERCDRKCEIARIRIDGKTHPFGGACNRWYNLRLARRADPEGLDLVRRWERLAFDKADVVMDRPAGVVGLNKSFFTDTCFPLYRRFFEELGFAVALPETVRQEGVDRRGAAFCYPVEISHGFLQDLLELQDRLALPAAIQGGRAAKRQRAGPGQEHHLPALAGRALLPGHGLQGPPGLSDSEKSRAHPVARYRFLERA